MSFISSSASTTSNLTATTSSLAAASARLSAGKRLTQASDDVADLVIGSALTSQTTDLRAQLSNFAQGASLLQVADAGLGQQADILDRQKALATEASSGTLSDATRGALNQEFQGLTQELDQISGSTNFNGVPLLDGSYNSTIGGSGSAGVQVTLGSSASSALYGGQTLDISTAAGASAASATLDSAITSLASNRANVGSIEAQFDANSASLSSALQSQTAAASALTDTDIASESTNYAALSVQAQAEISTQAQTNKLSGSLLQLIQSI